MDGNPLDPREGLEPKTVGGELGRVAKWLESKGADPDRFVFQKCEPVPMESWTAPDAPYTVGVRITAKHYRQEFPAAVLGIGSFAIDDEVEVLRYARRQAVELYGAPDESFAELITISNDEWKRRDHATRALPKILEQFPLKNMREWKSLTPTAWNDEAIKAARNWSESIDRKLSDGRGLSIRNATTGSGKTALFTVAIIEAVRQYPATAFYVFVPDLVELDFGETRNRTIEAAKSADLLLLDDVDARVRPSRDGDEDSSKSRGTLLAIVNERYNEGRPTLWTSNAASGEQFVERVGERIARRLAHNCRKLEFGPGVWDWTSKYKSTR